MNWLHVLWFGYAWPSDKGNGPEALQQTAFYALIAVVFVPVIRHFVQREFTKAHEELHRKLDHIIKHHPDIPELPPKEST